MIKHSFLRTPKKGLFESRAIRNRYNTESRLAKFGYNNQQNTLERERRSALKRALIGGMSISEITSHLSWLILRNSENPSFRNTILRWGDDIQWLEMHN